MSLKEKVEQLDKFWKQNSWNQQPADHIELNITIGRIIELLKEIVEKV